MLWFLYKSFAAYPHQLKCVAGCFEPAEKLRRDFFTSRIALAASFDCAMEAADRFPRDFFDGPMFVQVLRDQFAGLSYRVTFAALGLDGGPKG